MFAPSSAATSNSVAAHQRVIKQAVSKWRARFIKHRLDGLLNAPRRAAHH
jgi:hypothetical protein